MCENIRFFSGCIFIYHIFAILINSIYLCSIHNKLKRLYYKPSIKYVVAKSKINVASENVNAGNDN